MVLQRQENAGPNHGSSHQTLTNARCTVDPPHLRLMEVSTQLQKSLVLYRDLFDHGFDLICLGYYPYLSRLYAYR